MYKFQQTALFDCSYSLQQDMVLGSTNKMAQQS